MNYTLLLASLLLATAEAADPPAQVFQVNCSACHAVDQMLVGPSLVEIAGIYKDHADDFVKWCVSPVQKRAGVIEMPSMAHLGEPVLRELHGYILEAAKGKTELKKGDGDPYSVPAAMVRRPQVQRIFLPDASPAAIAVALPGDLSFCFDAAECRLRYVWKGGFINGTPYWKANGSSLAKIDGEVVYREPDFPLAPLVSVKTDGPKFLGYRIDKDGIPTFRYNRDGVNWEERIIPLSDGTGIERRFKTNSASELIITTSDDVDVSSSSGGEKVPGPAAKFFTLIFRWK